MITDFHNFFTDRLASKFIITLTSNIPPHLTNVATLLYEISEFKKCRFTQWLNKSNCHVRLRYSESLLKVTCLVMTPLQSDKDTLSGHAKISHHCTRLPRQRKRCRGIKPQLTSDRSVTDNVNLSISGSNWSTASSYLLMLKSKLLRL